MSTRRILAFTGIRSDYDLMSGLYTRIHQDPSMTLGLIVAGAHLSDSFGYTVRHIEEDGLPILARIESLLDSNSRASRLKSAAILLQGCLNVVEYFRPDVIMFPGDREDVMVGALVGAYLGIPTVHFFGGDHAADGHVDNPLRHATTKLSTLHFVSAEQHKQRLLKLAEPEERIFVIGSPALDRFVSAPWIKKEALLAKMGRPDWDKYALVIHHPILGEATNPADELEAILQALRNQGIRAFVSYPNTDAGSRDLIRVIERHAQEEQFCFYRNLERNDFINLMRHAAFMAGNSSAGVIEAPLIPLGVVNVGARQRGRLAANNVLFVDAGLKEIEAGIQTVLDGAFQDRLKGLDSLYGRGDSVEKAFQLLKELEFQRYIRKTEDPLTCNA